MGSTREVLPLGVNMSSRREREGKEEGEEEEGGDDVKELVE